MGRFDWVLKAGHVIARAKGDKAVLVNIENQRRPLVLFYDDVFVGYYDTIPDALADMERCGEGGDDDPLRYTDH